MPIQKKIKTIATILIKKTQKAFSDQMNKQGLINSYSFQNTVKPFLTNKG